MHPILRNILAVIAGIIVGSLVNMGLIQLGHIVVPPPAGADLSTMEGLAAAIPDFEPKHYVSAFVAHGLGTLVGAFVAALIAATHKMKFALAIGLWFLIGGIAVTFMIPSPTWFNVVDWVFAYFPMAWIGGRLGMRGK